MDNQNQTAGTVTLPLDQTQQAQQEPPQENRLPIKRTVEVKTKKGEDVLVKTSKLDLFLTEYEKNGGNGTEAALKVFNTTSRVNAANLAQTYLKRAQALGRMHMEKKGFTYERLIDMAAKRMQNAGEKSADFVALFDRLMKIGGYEDFLTKQGVTKATVSVLEVQKNLIDEFVEGEIVEEENE